MSSGLESSLFVVWAKGRHCEERILADLQRRFEVLSVDDVTWTPGRVNENFRRFYADLPVRGVYHQLSKGAGPFLAVVVRDREPVVEERMTSRGLRTVNGRFLDAKTLYREWAGQLTIHCTETPWETDRDLTMLFGVEEGAHRTSGGPWTGRIERIERDLTGSGGWRSESELFGVLNRSVVYLVTGAAGAASGPAIFDAFGGIDLLTDDYGALHAILGARPREAPRRGGRFRVRIAGRWVDVGIRYVGDGSYCTAWASALVASRVRGAAGFYRSPDRDAFETFAYDAFVRTPAPGAELRRRLATWASELDIRGWTPAALANAHAKPLLDEMLARHAYSYSVPLDTTRYFNHRIAGSGWPRLRSATRLLSALARRTTDPLHAAYWRARDRLIVVPGVRAVKRSLSGVVGMRGRLSRLLRSRRLNSLKHAALLLRGLAFAGLKYRCPCCGWGFRGFAGQWGILAANRDGYCPRCNAKARHRRLWLYLREHSSLFSGEHRLLEVAPWWALSRRFARMPNIRFVGLDLERRGPQVTVQGDATSIPLHSESLDAALCVHTLEHVEEDRRAIAELYRVLKPGGWAIVSVPIRLDQATFEDPAIKTPEERARAFGEASHVRFYGIDLQDRLEAAGFVVHLDRAEGVAPETRSRFGLREDENIFHCRKPGIGDRIRGRGK